MRSRDAFRALAAARGAARAAEAARTAVGAARMAAAVRRGVPAPRDASDDEVATFVRAATFGALIGAAAAGAVLHVLRSRGTSAGDDPGRPGPAHRGD